MTGGKALQDHLLHWKPYGNTEQDTLHPSSVTTYHTLVEAGDDILRKFWEIEEPPTKNVDISMEEQTVLRHFEQNHSRKEDGRFVVPLPKNNDVDPFGESRS